MAFQDRYDEDGIRTRDRAGYGHYRSDRDHDYDRDYRGGRGPRARGLFGPDDRTRGVGSEYPRSYADRGYGSDETRRGLPIEETSRLIASNKVEGTRVYGSDGRRLGHVYNFMVDKRGGQVEYAVMAYGGFLGMGERYYPLPWRTLHYDKDAGGYAIDLTERDLEYAPSFTRDSEPLFDRAYGERVYGWYGLNY